MATTRMQLGEAGDARLRALTRAGGTAVSVSATLRAEGWPVSRATVQRRMQELRGKVRPGRPNAKPQRPVAPVAAPEATPLPSEPEDVPDGASLPELAALLERCKAALTAAEDEGNLPLVGQMIRVAAAITETMRKATPPARPDPNDSPDMVALGKAVAERVHEMIAMVVAQGAAA